MNNVVRNRLSRKVNSLSVDKEELRRLLNILQKRADSACDIEFQILQAANLDNINQVKEDLYSCAPLKITIVGTQSEELFGTIGEVFNSVSFPEKIKSVYLNSELNYRTFFKYFPQNSFELLIDFSKPKVFDFDLQPYERTPNQSEFTVQGADNTWVNGVFHEIDSFIKGKTSKFSYVHRGSLYSLLVWFLGMPLGFWVCCKILKLNLEILNTHIFAEAIILTYSFLASLFIFRILFHYFRWIYPMVEYKSKKDRSIIHQTALFSIVLGLIGKLIYDLIKFAFTI